MVTKNRGKAIIIGSGIAGIAASIRLAQKGYQVDVFEKNEKPGGKLTEFQLGAYRFDFGPSLFTMPEYVLELFELCGKSYNDYFDFVKLEEACTYFYSDGSIFKAPSDAKKFAEKASEFFEIDKDKILKYFNKQKNTFEKSGKIFLNNSMHKLSTFLHMETIVALTQSYLIDLVRSMHQANQKTFTNPKLVQLFDRYATYNGSSPYKAPAILNSISILEHQYGTFFPNGGMYSITKAIHNLAIDVGVTFHFNKLVEEIITEEKKVTGILVDGEIITADLIISNMDVNFTYQKLLKKHPKPKRYLNYEKSSSTVIFYWGLDKNFKQIGLHNILFSSDYRQEFEDIFVNKKLNSEPTIYINNTSSLSPSDAPPGGSNWFVMINTPAKNDATSLENIKDLRKKVVSIINDRLQIDIESFIREERIVNPHDIESQTLSHLGSLYGSSSNHWMSAFLRHPNFSSKHNGLYFVGGSVHPGGGIPLCLLSAKITSSLID